MKKTRVLVGTLGLDQHETGAIAVARLLRDAGMEVIYAGRFNMPPMIVQMAMEEDVDVIGLSCHSWEYLYYLPEIIKILEKKHLQISVVAGGSVITKKDEEFLSKQGVAAVFGPNSSEREIIEGIKSLSEGE